MYHGFEGASTGELYDHKAKSGSPVDRPYMPWFMCPDICPVHVQQDLWTVIFLCLDENGGLLMVKI